MYSDSVEKLVKTRGHGDLKVRVLTLAAFAGPLHYGLKHEVESWAGTYTSNGALIAAALRLGFKCHAAGPNVVLTVGATARPSDGE